MRVLFGPPNLIFRVPALAGLVLLIAASVSVWQRSAFAALVLLALALFVACLAWDGWNTGDED